MTVADLAGEGGAEPTTSLRSPKICDGHRPPLQTLAPNRTSA
jgi:hypothetical protein